MNEDDIYPLDGAAFLSEPREQVDERNKEKGKALAALPLLEDIIERLQNRIDYYGSVDAIPDDVKVDPKAFLIIHNANELTRNNLRAEKENLEGMIDDFKR